MAPANYALQVTLVSKYGTPLLRCWGPAINLSETSQGMHHFIVSFDASVPRVQIAMDRGGGPIFGGGVMDTNLGTGVISSTGAFPALPAQPVSGTAPQGMYAKLDATSLDGFAPIGGTVTAGEKVETLVQFKPVVDDSGSMLWDIAAAFRYTTDFAYIYFGVSPNNTFFDLTAGSSNLNYFITSGLSPVNLGNAGTSVEPLESRIMHTGGTRLIYGIDNNFTSRLSPMEVGQDTQGLTNLPQEWNANTRYNPGDYVRTTTAPIYIGDMPVVGIRFWLALPVIGTLSEGARTNIDKSPLEFGRPLNPNAEFTQPPFWTEVNSPIQAAEFRWNAANGQISKFSGLMTDVASP